MAFFGPALLLMRITLDAKYGIYPTMLLCRGISCVRARCPGLRPGAWCMTCDPDEVAIS
jgi:hypothetical protein